MARFNPFGDGGGGGDVGSTGRAEFATSTTTGALAFVTLYACTDTTAPRTLTISSADIAKASTTNPWRFRVKDESGGAGTNNIIIDTEGAETIDGSSSVSIVVGHGVVRLYSDGSNLFSW